LNPLYEFLCRNFASIGSIFWVLRRLPAEMMFGGLKKSPFLGPIFGALPERSQKWKAKSGSQKIALLKWTCFFVLFSFFSAPRSES
jgi:hypothetical protein